VSWTSDASVLLFQIIRCTACCWCWSASPRCSACVPDAARLPGSALQMGIRVLYLVVTPGDTLRPEIERDVLAWIAKRRASDRANGRDLMEFVQARDLQRRPRRFRDYTPEGAEAIFMLLEDQGWLLRTDSAGRSGSRTRWQVRPDLEDQWTT
jgi:hypothetical protein